MCCGSLAATLLREKWAVCKSGIVLGTRSIVGDSGCDGFPVPDVAVQSKSLGKHHPCHLLFCFQSHWTAYILLFASAILILSSLAGCSGPGTEELEAVDYTPLPGDDWAVSTPAEQGLDPMLVAELYYNRS
jgi:hypothetical protein